MSSNSSYGTSVELASCVQATRPSGASLAWQDLRNKAHLECDFKGSEYIENASMSLGLGIAYAFYARNKSRIAELTVVGITIKNRIANA